MLEMAGMKVILWLCQVAGIGIRILKHFLPGGLPQRPVDVIRVAEVAILLERLVGCPPALVGHGEIEDEAPLHAIMVEAALA